MSFSERTAWKRVESDWARRQREARFRPDVIDLTGSNPTQQGFIYEPETLRAFFPVTDRYIPAPLGDPVARDAIAAYIRGHGGNVPPESIWVGAGTSELYAHLLSLLCNPGEACLVPQPGYPLLSYLADMAGVRLIEYPVQFDGAWHISVDAIRALVRAHPAIRVLHVVSPHNPTGHVWSDAERSAIQRCCAEHDLALVVDEVFLDYPIASAQPIATAAVADAPCLTFTLSGLSKVAALPQGKLAWAAVGGPESAVHETLGRAELLADTFLNVSTVIQQGTPAALSEAPRMQERIRVRCRNNREHATACFADTAVTPLPAAAGWSLLLRMPAFHSDEVWSARLLTETGIMTQPGYLFGLEQQSRTPFLVLSLITEATRFRSGCEQIRDVVLHDM